MLSQLNDCRSFIDVWERSSREFADKTAFIHRGESFSYFETRNMVDSFAYALLTDYEIKPGDRVGLVLKNGLSFIVSYLACQKIRAVPVPFNTRMKGWQIDSLLSFLKPSAVIVDASFQQVIEPLLRSHPYIHYRFGVGIPDPSWEGFEALASLGGSDDMEFPEPQPEDIATILFTSGTTGKPKGAIIRHKDLLWNMRITAKVFSFTTDDIHILAVPLFHCTGLESIFPTSVLWGSTCVLEEQISPSYLADLIDETKATTFITVPTTLYLMTSYGDLDVKKLSSLRLVGFSGSPIRKETVLKLASLLPDCELVNFYGLTETTSIISACYRSDLLKSPGSIGRPLEEIRVALGSDGVPEEGASSGELLIRREHIVSGYYSMPMELEGRIRDGWFRTGDLARVTPDGLIFLEGRNIDLIIVGGENVLATEVEDVLNSHPDVRDSAVVGIPNRIFGEVVKAYVVPKVPEAALALEIKKFCSERLPSYKVPLEIDFVREIPRSPSGKILKGLLKTEESK
ncbi:MAG: long-chain fatty acid--CoA ligase [Planctomycetota bacterium]